MRTVNLYSAVFVIVFNTSLVSDSEAEPLFIEPRKEGRVTEEVEKSYASIPTCVFNTIFLNGVICTYPVGLN